MQRSVTSGRTASYERWMKAAQRARDKGIEVRQLNTSGQWVANSGSDPNKSYELKIVNGLVRSCSCEAGQFGDPCCCHAAAFYLSVGMIELPEAPAPAVVEGAA